MGINPWEEEEKKVVSELQLDCKADTYGRSLTEKKRREICKQKGIFSKLEDCVLLLR